MDSTVISATIDGKDYRFVGKLEKQDANGFEHWNGRTEAGEMLMLTRSSTGVHGFVVGQKTYQFVNLDHRQAMIEIRKDMPSEKESDEYKPQPPAKLK